MAVRVPYWTMQIKRGVDFTATLVFRSDGVPFDFDSAEILILPQVGGEIAWTEGNGKFTHLSLGTYKILIESTETAAYLWNGASWRLNVVRDSEPNPSFTSGRVLVAN